MFFIMKMRQNIRHRKEMICYWPPEDTAIKLLGILALCKIINLQKVLSKWLSLSLKKFLQLWKHLIPLFWCISKFLLLSLYALWRYTSGPKRVELINGNFKIYLLFCCPFLQFILKRRKRIIYILTHISLKKMEKTFMEVLWKWFFVNKKFYFELPMESRWAF